MSYPFTDKIDPEIVKSERIAALESRLAEADNLLREILDKDKSISDLIEAGNYLSILAAKIRAYFAKKEKENEHHHDRRD